MKKIFIVGPSGSGKTTLAKELSSILNIKHTELDGIYHQSDWTPIDAGKFKDTVEKITNKDSWIICGNYYSLLGKDHWSKADAIIWCDYSFTTVLARLLKRTLDRSITKKELWNGNKESLRMQFFSKDSVLYYMIRTWRNKKQRYENIFVNSDIFEGADIIRLKTQKDKERLINQVGR
jgi:adenylate kinase family enzyme